MASLLMNHVISLKSRAGVYQVDITSVIYGVETWALTGDCRMLRHSVGIGWQDRVPSVGVANRCRIEDLETVLKK